MKYKIEKNTVQETLILPLYSRKLCTELYPNLYRDETAVSLINEIDYDFSEAEKNSRGLMQRFGSLEVAMRQNDLAFEVKDYLKIHPNAAVVNLGCGLDNTGRSCDNGSCKIYNLDFPDVIAVRNKLLPAGDREENIPCDLNNTEWFSKIDTSGGAVFFASGVFYYFLTKQVKTLVQGMADAFSGGVLAFAVGLHLSEDETIDLLKSAGYAFSDGSKRDWIVRYCLEHKIYNINQVNTLLFEYDQEQLGA